MNKKKIISTTLMFLVIVIAVVLFKSVFGAENTLVGVAGITAALSLLGTDYSLNPIKNTIYFVVLEVGLGVATYLASINAFLGLIITFAVIFYILYSFTYNTKKPTYVAFTLGYFFMLYTPVTLYALPNRLYGLAFCGLLVMILQLFANKDRLKKQSSYQLKQSIKYINEEVSLILLNENKESILKLSTLANKNLKNLVETINDVIDKDIQIPMFMFQNLFIAQFLNSINLVINKINKDYDINNNKNLNKLLELLYKINSFVEEKEDVHILLCYLDKYLESTDFMKSKSYLDFELNSYVSILRKDLENTESNNVSDVSKQYFVRNLTSQLDSFKNNINKDSLKFTFAFRGALVTSLGVFIVSLFDIPNGKWLVFSLMSIVQPYLDSSKAKGHERLLGTVIGLIIFEVVFNIIQDTSIRTIIILLVGYISNYQTKYKYQMICTTVSALGAASIGSNITMLGFERFIWVFIGTIIALYANKLILPYRVSEATKSDLNISIKLNEKIISLLYNKCLNMETKNEDLIKVVSVNKLLNKKIDSNNAMLLSNDLNNFIYTQHIFMNKIRVLLNMFSEYKLSTSKKIKLVYDIEYLIYKDLSREEILKYLERVDDSLTQLILINILEVKEYLVQSKYISRLVINSIHTD